MPCRSSFSSLVLQVLDEGSLSPTDFRGKVSKGAKLSKAAKFDGSQSVGNDLSLFGVVWGGDSLKDF